MTEGARRWDIIARGNELAVGLPTGAPSAPTRGDWGFAVTASDSLQTACRYRADRRHTSSALIHDIGDLLGSFNHADIGAAMVARTPLDGRKPPSSRATTFTWASTAT
jgi:hypothetical protein